MQVADSPVPDLWIWGADVDAQGVALCHVLPGTHQVAWTRVAVRLEPGPHRLGQILHRLMSATAEVADRYPPLAVFIEIPMGQHRRPELDHAYGLVAGALDQLLDALFPHPVSVFPVNSVSWKKTVLDNGALKKAQYMAIAQSNPILEGRDSDDVVAYYLALYGVRKLAENA